ncbi:MAG: hypothetical protein KIT87_06015 [Anaerolineae bacterium]|nr:hypothetical protein [Anaerolineae bacterium]
MKVTLDSRLVQPGEYFVPVKGDSLDGHAFIEQALKHGAAGVIEVEELYRMAQAKLKRVQPVIVGVAGSVGKSTVRAYLTQILSSQLRVLEGDLNTQLGLSVAIVNDLSDQAVFVAELGIDRLGEMQMVTDFLRPHLTLISKLEKEHLQFLFTFDNVVSENMVAIANSQDRKGYVNQADKPAIEPYSQGLNIVFYPDHIPSSVRETVSNLDLPSHEQDYLLGIYQVVKDNFGFSDSDFVNSLQHLRKPKGRLTRLAGENGSLIIDDTYNAVCDESVIRGIEFARAVAVREGRDLVVILSPMRETGASEAEQHRTVADYLNTLDIKDLILVGEKSDLYTRFLDTPYRVYQDWTEFAYTPSPSTLFYIKGSQYYRLEKIVYLLMRDKDKAAKLLVRQDARWT